MLRHEPFDVEFCKQVYALSGRFRFSEIRRRYMEGSLPEVDDFYEKDAAFGGESESYLSLTLVFYEYDERGTAPVEP